MKSICFNGEQKSAFCIKAFAPMAAEKCLLYKSICFNGGRKVPFEKSICMNAAVKVAFGREAGLARDSVRCLFSKSICTNRRMQVAFGRKAFEWMGKCKLPLVGKHLHEWVPDRCLCLKSICMNGFRRSDFYDKHLNEWAPQTRIPQSAFEWMSSAVLLSSNSIRMNVLRRGGFHWKAFVWMGDT